MGPGTVVRVENSATGRGLSAWPTWMGEDLVVPVGGGETPHVGCVVMAVPSPSKGGRPGWSSSSSVLTIPPHKEEPIARGIAERLANELGRVVVVTAGVHDDNLDRAGIEDYLSLAKELENELVARLRCDVE
jgi:hypothetical protein